jgi:hypothetical protein
VSVDAIVARELILPARDSVPWRLTSARRTSCGTHCVPPPGPCAARARRWCCSVYDRIPIGDFSRGVGQRRSDRAAAGAAALV